MQLDIRKATPADADAIVRFNRAMAEETEGKTLALGAITQGVRAVFEDPSRGFYLIAENAGSPIGGLLITTEWSDWRNGDFWWIQSVYVVPEFRGRGVYAALHRTVEEMARSSESVCGLRLYVDRNNTRAKSIYERLGMRPSHYDFYDREFGDVDPPKSRS